VPVYNRENPMSPKRDPLIYLLAATVAATAFFAVYTFI
jgi:hypothetical protein